MKVRSLGSRTDLIFAAFDGEVVDRGNYMVIRTPKNPTFYWGNFLLFDRPPEEGDYQRWRELFSKEIGAPPQVVHQTFGWDAVGDVQGCVEPFLENGYHMERSVVLATQKLNPPEGDALGVTVRPLQDDDDWMQSVENQVECRAPEFVEAAGYRLFRQRSMERYRAMSQAGLGAWFGAFMGNRLVADLGIFCVDQLGRYQYVQTHPQFRRKGIARRLVFESGRYVIDRFGLETLVIVAEADSAAQRLYQAAGFEVVEYQLGIGKWDGTPD